jgi:integrase/recombinase XerC/integrase/recombinase XerD
MGMTLQQAVDFFILDQQLRGNTDKTVTGYRGFLRRFCEWMASSGVYNMDDIEIQNINEYQLYVDRKPLERYGNRRLTKRSVQTYMRHIKCFLTYCHNEGFIREPLHLKIRMPKAERPVIEILTDDEIAAIFSCFRKTELGMRNTSIVMLMLDCGLRLAEVINIKSNDVNFIKGYITVMGKGRKGRIVPLGLKVRRALLAYIHKRRRADAEKDDEYLFLTKERKPLTEASIALVMRRLKKEASIPRIHAHLFRHTFATNFLIYGIGDVYELSRLLGHSDMKITESYLQLASYYTIIEKRGRRTFLDMQR